MRCFSWFFSCFPCGWNLNKKSIIFTNISWDRKWCGFSSTFCNEICNETHKKNASLLLSNVINSFIVRVSRFLLQTGRMSHHFFPSLVLIHYSLNSFWMKMNTKKRQYLLQRGLHRTLHFSNKTHTKKRRRGTTSQIIRTRDDGETLPCWLNYLMNSNWNEIFHFDTFFLGLLLWWDVACMKHEGKMRRRFFSFFIENKEEKRVINSTYNLIIPLLLPYTFKWMNERECGNKFVF